MEQIASFWENTAQTPLQILEDPFFIEQGIRFYVKRDDLINSFVSGNKWRKLKYNLLEAEKLGFEALLTFGGGYSNHIAAVAAAGQATGFKTIGFIRGEELNNLSNATLRFATNCGMKLIFVTREAYRHKEKLAEAYKHNCYIIPEGGSNALAVKGVAEVITELKNQIDLPIHYLCVALGTGGTAAGLASVADSKILAFPSLKITQEEAKAIIFEQLSRPVSNVEIMSDYHFGGYGKASSEELLNFIKNFEKQTNILLEQVYTGKMMFGIYDLLKKGYFKRGDVVVALHTGGLQGRSSKL